MLRALLLLLALAGPASAQTTLHDGDNLTAAQWLAVMQAQAIQAMGNSTSPVFLGTVNGADGTYPALTTFNTACMNGGVSASAMLCVRGRSGTTGGAPFLAMFSLDGYAGSTGDNVTLYANYRGRAGQNQQGWALNTITTLDSGANAGGIGYELDYNNNNCEWSTAGCSIAPTIGLYLQGNSAYTNTYGILVQGVNPGGVPQWRYGMYFTTSIRDYDIVTLSSANSAYLLSGTHATGITFNGASISANGIDFSGSTIGGNAIQTATNQRIAIGPAIYLQGGSDYLQIVSSSNIPAIIRGSGIIAGVPISSSVAGSSNAVVLSDGQRLTFGGAAYMTSNSTALYIATSSNIPVQVNNTVVSLGVPLQQTACPSSATGLASGTVWCQASDHTLHYAP